MVNVKERTLGTLKQNISFFGDRFVKDNVGIGDVFGKHSGISRIFPVYVFCIEALGFIKVFEQEIYVEEIRL